MKKHGEQIKLGFEHKCFSLGPWESLCTDAQVNDILSSPAMASAATSTTRSEASGFHKPPVEGLSTSSDINGRKLWSFHDLIWESSKHFQPTSSSRKLADIGSTQVRLKHK